MSQGRSNLFQNPLRWVLPSFLLAVALVCVGCGGGPGVAPAPTVAAAPTRVAQVLPSPTAALPTPTPHQRQAKPSATPIPLATDTPTPAPSPTAAWTPSRLHEILARGTVRMLLQGLADREAPALWATQLTDQARQAYQDLLLGRFAASSPHLSRFDLGEATPLPDGRGYAVPATLYETLADGTLVGVQEVTFIVVREDRLWLVDALEMGAYRQPTPTPRPSATARSAPPSLQGTIALEDSPGGNIYLLRADGSELRLLTRGMDPALSPDGRWVAFVRWEEPRGLYLIGADGQGERLLYGAPQVRTPAWSPDGRRLAFAIQKGGKPERRFRFGDREFVIPADPYWRLAWVDVETGAYHDLPSDLHSLAPAWSPDGAWLLYAGDGGLQRLALEAGEQELAVEGDHLAAPDWSPDGRWIAYQERRHDHWELFARPAWGGDAIPLTPALALAGPAHHSVSPTFSPDGQWLLFASDREGGRWNLYLVRPDGTGLRPLFPSGLPNGLELHYRPDIQRALSWGP